MLGLTQGNQTMKLNQGNKMIRESPSRSYEKKHILVLMI